MKEIIIDPNADPLSKLEEQMIKNYLKTLSKMDGGIKYQAKVGLQSINFVKIQPCSEEAKQDG